MDQPNIMCEKKVKENTENFALSNWKNGVVINQDRGACWEEQVRGGREWGQD